MTIFYLLEKCMNLKLDTISNEEFYLFLLTMVSVEPVFPRIATFGDQGGTVMFLKIGEF